MKSHVYYQRDSALISHNMLQQISSTGISTSSYDLERLQEFACRLSTGVPLLTNQEFTQLLKCLQQSIPRTCSESATLALSILTTLVKGGQSKRIAGSQKLLKAMVKHFNKMAQELQDCAEAETETSKVQYKMLAVLSLMSQVIHENRGCAFPFTKGFLNNLFMISSDFVATSSLRKETSRILSVLLEALSERPSILTECAIFPRFRQVLLGNFKVVSDKNSFNRLMRALRRATIIQPFSAKELISSGVIQTVQKFLGKETLNHLLSCLDLQAKLLPYAYRLTSKNMDT